MTPLVLVPGHLCGAWLYEPQIEALTDAHDVILADTLKDDTIEAMAERLLRTAPERFAIVGLSMGAMVAMEVLTKAPDRVLGACLMDTDPTAARAKEIAWRNDLLRAGFDQYVEAFVRRFYFHDSEVAARLGPVTRAKMASMAEPVARAQAHALDQRREMLPLISGFEGPVEILAGAEDKVCPPRLHEPLAQALPGSTLTLVPNCGHIPTLERPDHCMAVLIRFLARLEGNGTART